MPNVKPKRERCPHINMENAGDCYICIACGHKDFFSKLPNIPAKYPDSVEFENRQKTMAKKWRL